MVIKSQSAIHVTPYSRPCARTAFPPDVRLFLPSRNSQRGALLLFVSASVGCAAAELAGSYSVKTFRFCFYLQVRPLLPDIQKSPALRRLLRRHRLYSPAARKRFGHPHSCTHPTNAMNASARFFVQSRTLVQARGTGLNRAAVKRAALPLLYIAYCGAFL